MGEILLATTIILLAAVLYYVNKNKPSNKKEFIHNSNYPNGNNSVNNLNRIQNLYHPNYDNYDEGIYTPDKRYFGKDLNHQNHNNVISHLDNEYYNTSIIKNNIKNNPLILNNSYKNKIKINNIFITPTKDDSFLNNNYRGTGLNEFTSAVSRPELIIRNKRKSYDDNDLSSDIYDKATSKYFEDSTNKIIIKDLSKKPTKERFLDILNYHKDRFLRSKYLNLNFYKNLLVSLMQIIIEYIKGEVVVGHDNRFVHSPNNKEKNRESIDNNRHKNEFHITAINKNLTNGDFIHESSEEINQFNSNILNGFTRNMIPVNDNSVQDLNEYIKNNDRKKLKVRDLIFSDYNTHENFSLNRNNFSKQMNNFSANNYNEEIINYPNSVRENVFEKNNIPNYNNFNLNRKVNQPNDKVIYCGNNGGIDTYYLKPKTDIDWDYDVINSVKKSPMDRKNIYNELIKHDPTIKNKYLDRNLIKDLKIASNPNEIEYNFNLEGFLNKKDIVNKNHVSPIQNDKEGLVNEKSDSFSQKDFKNQFMFNDNKLLNQEFDMNNALQRDNPPNNLNLVLSPQLKLHREFTPKNKNNHLKNTISDKENYHDNCKGIVDISQNKIIQTSKSPIRVNNEQGKKQPLDKLGENKEIYNFNYDHDYCEQTGTPKNNKFSELLINQKPSITQAKAYENNFFDLTKNNLEDIIPKVRIGDKIRTTIFKKSDKINQLEDINSQLTNSISLNYDNSEKKFSHNDIIPSPIPGEKTDQKGNLTQKLPSTIKKNDVINTNLLLSSGNKININKKNSLANSFEKALVNNEIENNPRRFTIDSDNINNNLSTNDRKNSRSKKEASNFRKKSNKKMTFAPSEYKDFSELELNKSRENKIVSLIPEENESNFTKTNLINTPSINIKKVNFECSKEKINPLNNKNPLENMPERSLLKENLPPKSRE